MVSLLYELFLTDTTSIYKMHVLFNSIISLTASSLYTPFFPINTPDPKRPLPGVQIHRYSPSHHCNCNVHQ